jgi:hypothetical protein
VCTRVHIESAAYPPVQFVSSPEDSQKKHGALKTTFFNIKRRITEAVLEGVGKAKKSEDASFDARKARALVFC